VTDDKKPELLTDQYNQYWEMCRFHLSLSWNIPTLAIAGILALAATDPDARQKWFQEPLLPAVTMLVASLFVLLMYIHHRRNLLFAATYEKAIEELERDHGKQLGVLHHQVQARLRGFDRLSSSTCLGAFILVLGLFLIALDLYLWTLVF